MKQVPAPQTASNIASLVWVQNSRTCRVWPASTEGFLTELQGNLIEGPWQAWEFKTVDVGTVAGVLNTLKYGELITPVLLALDGQGKVQAAKSRIPTAFHVEVFLRELASGRGTKAHIDRRLALNPKDGDALWELHLMQSDCSALGSADITAKRIVEIDPEHKTAAGELELVARSMHAFLLSILMHHEEPLYGLEERRTWIRALSHPRARSFANQILAELSLTAGRIDLARDLFLDAWTDCADGDQDRLAVQIRESATWLDRSERAADPSWSALEGAASSALARLRAQPLR